MLNFTPFFGVCEDRDDPLKLGRIRIRVPGIHPDDKTAVPTSSLPWAMPIQWLQSAAADGIGWSPVGPIVGTKVFGFWCDGDDSQIPIYMGTIGGDVGHLSFKSPSTSQPTKKPTQPASKKSQKLGDVSGDKAAILTKKLQERYGLTDYQAAGIVGNIAHESGLRPNVREGGSLGEPWPKGTKRKGYGYAQWTNSRLDAYIDYCDANKLDPQSDEANYQYLCHEFDTTERKTISEVKKTDSLESATKSVMNTFEKPKADAAHLDRRITLAGKALKGTSGVNVPVRTVGEDEKVTTPEQADAPVADAPDDQPSTQIIGNEPPRSKYRGKYPYNKTFRSESGHLIEIDDTPGRERLLDYHTIGTYREITETGREVVRVVADRYVVVAQDNNLYVQGNVNVFVDGNANIKVGGDAVTEIGGNQTTTVAGDFRLKAASIAMESTGDASIKSGGGFAVDGSTIDWNSGKAKGAGTSVALTPEHLSFELDDDFEGTKMKEAVDSGLVKQDDLNNVPPADKADETQGKNTGPASVTCDGLESATDFPDSLKLSDNFTLGSLSRFAAAGSHTLTEQRGLSKGQIACNLSLLAKNVLEKIRTQYPNMIVTSGFRAVQTGTSQHEIGQAADFQIPNTKNSEYIDIAKWIRDESGIMFDQLLLEGKSYASGNAWIHISFNKDNNRGQVLSLFNNKIVATGLAQMYK